MVIFPMGQLLIINGKRVNAIDRQDVEVVKDTERIEQ